MELEVEDYSCSNTNTVQDFDELDIEGRITIDEWKCEDEDSPKEDEEKTLLDTTVLLDDGRYGYVYTCKRSEESLDGKSWICSVCSLTTLSFRLLQQHSTTAFHKTKMQLKSHPPSNFTKLVGGEDRIMPELEPGEPVPPGMEDMCCQPCTIQATLDVFKSHPLIGLEYLVELVRDDGDQEERYLCLLCEKKGDPRNVFVHLTSCNHYMKYFTIYFREVSRALNMVPRSLETRKGLTLTIKNIATKIEEKFGRLMPQRAEMEKFDSEKPKILRHITAGRHFKETPEENFADLVDLEFIKSHAFQFDDSQTAHYNLAVFKENPADEKQLSQFKQSARINVDKRQLRIRPEKETDEKVRSESPDIIEVEHVRKPPLLPGADLPPRRKPKPPVKQPLAKDKTLSPISSNSSRSPPTGGGQSKSTRTRSSSRGRARRSSSRGRKRSTSRGKHSDSRGMRSNSRGRRSNSRGRRSNSRGRRRSRSPNPIHRSRHIIPASSSYSWQAKTPKLPYQRRRSRSRSGSPHSRGRPVRSDHSSKDREKSKEDLSLPVNQHMKSSRDRYPTAPPGISPLALDKQTEKFKWEKFRHDLSAVEKSMSEKLKYHEKNPEKHPRYPEEWKAFWNRRYKELQAAGKDPSKHDFKPEWIAFWNRRMKEMHESELMAKKEELKLQLQLPIEKPTMIHKDTVKEKLSKHTRYFQDSGFIAVSPPKRQDVTVTDIKNTWKALTGSDIKDPSIKRPLSPWESESESMAKDYSYSKTRPISKTEAFNRGNDRAQGLQIVGGEKTYDPPVVALLRLLAVLEDQLGSLGPKILALLSQALALEKSSPTLSMTMLDNAETCILIETVKQKLRGQLNAGIVERNLVNTTRRALRHIMNILEDAPMHKAKEITAPRAFPAAAPFVAPVASQPMSVPGVGTVDKVAIAQQIAAALVLQGKTDVTHDELEQLINAVVGMAQANTALNSTTHRVTMDSLQSSPVVNKVETTAALTSSVTTSVTTSLTTSNNSAGLKLLQNAYDEHALTEEQKADASSSAMDDLSEEDLKNLLQNFKDLPREEQSGLISYLKRVEKTDPERVEKLRKFVDMGPTGAEIAECSEKQITSSGRLSPFSLRSGGTNPTPRSQQKTNVDKKQSEETMDLDDDDDDDDDYSFEDVYKAASAKLKENSDKKDDEKMADVKQATASPKTVKDTGDLIANLMNHFPAAKVSQPGLTFPVVSNEAAYPGSSQDNRDPHITKYQGFPSDSAIFPLAQQYSAGYAEPYRGTENLPQGRQQPDFGTHSRQPSQGPGSFGLPHHDTGGGFHSQHGFDSYRAENPAFHQQLQQNLYSGNSDHGMMRPYRGNQPNNLQANNQVAYNRYNY